jgi:hypothetical protein
MTLQRSDWNLDELPNCCQPISRVPVAQTDGQLRRPVRYPNLNEKKLRNVRNWHNYGVRSERSARIGCAANDRNSNHPVWDSRHTW